MGARALHCILDLGPWHFDLTRSKGNHNVYVTRITVKSTLTKPCRSCSRRHHSVSNNVALSASRLPTVKEKQRMASQVLDTRREARGRGDEGGSDVDTKRVNRSTLAIDNMHPAEHNDNDTGNVNGKHMT